MDKLVMEDVKEVFGFLPSERGELAKPLEQVIVNRKLEELAEPWGKAHDEITQIRAKFEASTDSIPGNQALEDHARIVVLGAERERAQNAWFRACDVAVAGKYKVNGDIKENYKPKK